MSDEVYFRIGTFESEYYKINKVFLVDNGNKYSSETYIGESKTLYFDTHSLHCFCFTITLEQRKQRSLGSSGGGRTLLRDRKVGGQF